MKRLLLIPLAALSLGGCAGILPALLGPAPQAVQTASAPLARISVDETALRGLFESLDALRAGIDGLVARGDVVRNTPRALRVRAGLSAARNTLNAADDLRIVMNNPVQSLSPADLQAKLEEYRAALRNARTAFAEIAAALRER